SIQPDTMKKELQIGAEVIDVRKPSEWIVSHVKNAIFLPLSGMPGNLESMNKTKHYLVHCGGGYRSMTAISLMKRQGFMNLTNIYGGFGAILDSGVEVVAEDATVASN
ncbi:MAG TPA: rhodanese-like domain-containing protein, partial [Cyclobacteriaceae bacterium]|nr:rhodanese-like domain-containing protein [Cyclobacteriaceae bacterium]